MVNSKFFPVRQCLSLTGILFVLVGVDACSLPRFAYFIHGGQECTLGRETAAISSLRIIHNSQTQYWEKYNRFGTLIELAAAGLISSSYTNGQPVTHYIYSDSEISPKTYCVSATRDSHNSWFGLLSSDSTYRDFIVCEDATIRANESKTIRPMKCGEGQPISESQP